MNNFFKNLWRRIIPQDKIPLVKKEENALVLSLDANNVVTLRISIQNINPDSAEFFAKSIFALQSGLYADDILDIITQLGLDPSSVGKSNFTKILLSKYTLCFDTVKELSYNRDSVPLVSPLRFSAIVNGDK